MLLRNKQARLITGIDYFREGEVTCITKLSAVADMTYGHASRVLKNFEKLGLIRRKKIGRTCLLELTEKGKRVQSLILKLKQELKC